MAILDAPVTTDDRNVEKVLQQPVPSMLIMHRDDIDKPLDDALVKAAKKYAGQLLIVRLNVNENPDTYAYYDKPATPALVTFAKNASKLVADAEDIRPADVRNHIRHLLKGKPLPKARKEKNTLNAPVTVTDSTFRKEVLKSNVPVLVDFWAEWCAPCRSIAPHVAKLAEQHGGKIKVAKLDVDRNPVMARRFGVSSIPTFIVFEQGQIAERSTGASPRTLRKLVDRYIF